jgi:putative lipoprotein
VTGASVALAVALLVQAGGSTARDSTARAVPSARAQSPRDSWFGADKLKHFLVAAFTQSVAYSALQAAKVGHDGALAGAWGVTAAVSVAKELHDKRTTGLFSTRDLVWDAAGAGAATVLLVRSRRRERATDSAVPAARGHVGQTATSSVLRGR